MNQTCIHTICAELLYKGPNAHALKLKKFYTHVHVHAATARTSQRMHAPCISIVYKQEYYFFAGQAKIHDNYAVTSVCTRMWLGLAFEGNRVSYAREALMKHILAVPAFVANKYRGSFVLATRM